MCVIGGATSSALSLFLLALKQLGIKRRPFLAATEISSDAFVNGCNSTPISNPFRAHQQ